MVSRFKILAAAACIITGIGAAARQSATQPTTQLVALPSVQPLTKSQTDFFESKIRPLFASHCYECHSAEQHKSKGGLVLDSREGWQKGGKHGPAIVAGDPAKSLLLKAVNHLEPDLEMPPDGAKLKDSELAALAEWVKMGAPDPRVATASKLTGLTDKARAHWSYQRVANPPIPNVASASWIKTPIDAFILAKLEANQMQPSPAVNRETLIRRATYDLIGLPPTPEEVSDFVNDSSADAFAKVVDRLLASPHYGERWGRFWLDTARYSDTTGAEKNKGEYRFPFAWTYRDYVINSFNADKPYDVFLKEQIAADLLPSSKDDPARLAALGFITVGKRFQNPNDTIDERIDTLTKGTMALTVSCARCHDHKFDPIPTADYYSLHGIFASTIEPSERPLMASVPTDPAYQDFKQQLAKLEAKDRELYYKLIEEKSSEFRKNAAAYVMVATIGGKNRADLLLVRNKIISDHVLDRDIYQGGARFFRRDNAVFAPMFLFNQLPTATFSDGAKRVLAEIATGGKSRRPINALVVKALASVSPESLRSLQDVADVYGKLFADIDAKAQAYLHACQSATTDEVAGFDPDMVELFNVPAEIELAPALTTDRLTEIAPTLPVKNQTGYYHLALAQVNELLLTHPGSPARAMVVADAPRPHDSPIFIRGEAQNRGPVVPREFLEILSGPNRKRFTKGSGRLELADAIASNLNPLTARVMVNRIWMHHFGQGFVRTPDDLGVQCEDPSHPELLDYLATQFVKGGWSIKQMHRLIMLSSTYQESSETTATYAQKDLENRLLWRANLRRLDFEAVRDSMLTFTGKLDPAVGGKPVNLTDEPYSNRRSVYGYIDRGDVPELMAQFDFADPDMANSRRTSTIVPQQALFFMNSPMAVDVARKVTSRPEFVSARDDAGRVTALYQVLLQRPPKPQEIEVAKAFLQSAGAASDVASGDKPSGRPLTKQEERDARRAEAASQAQQKRLLEASLRAQKKGPHRAIRNDGNMVERKPLSAWEQYAQALLFTNEIAYVN